MKQKYKQGDLLLISSKHANFVRIGEVIKFYEFDNRYVNGQYIKYYLIDCEQDIGFISNPGTILICNVKHSKIIKL